MRHLILSLVLSAGLVMPAFASDPDFRQKVQDAAKQMRQQMSDPSNANLSRQERSKKSTEAMNAALKGMDVSKVSAEDMAFVIEQFPMIGASEAAGAVRNRLQELAEDDGEAGAQASLSRFMMDVSSPAGARLAGEFVKHPGFKDLIKAGKGADGLQRLGFVEDSVITSNKSALYALADVLPVTGTPQSARQLTAFFMNLVDVTPAEDKAAREPLRLKLIDRVKNAIASSSEGDGGAAMGKRLEADLKSLESTLAKGEFIGNPAPELTFTWTSPDFKMGDKAPVKLSDLKGKVVVLDFWATWCGPCVGSFPNVRDLAAHYKGHDVVILGVTSLQGNHVVWKDGRPSERVDTQDIAAKEYELMGTFMKDMDMTWPVAFSEQAVFNPEYGISGIPHVVILDVDGKVRFRGLHPASPAEEKHSKIDALLKEAGRSVPGGK
jgi:thiol-disulfide isomerase/thioredoxin